MISALRSSRHSAGIAGRDDLLGGVGDVEEVDAGLDADLVEHPDQRLDRRVARTGAEPAARPVDLLGARPAPPRSSWPRRGRGSRGRGNRPARRRRARRPARATRSATPSSTSAPAESTTYTHWQPASAMIRACAASFSGEMVWLIIRKPDGLQAELAGQPEVLDRDVGLGAVGGDPADRPAVVLRLLDVLLGADAGQHQERDLGFLRGLGRQLDQLLLGGLGEPVVEARPAQPVTVGHLDDRHPGGVQRRDDRADLVLGELVPLVVRRRRAATCRSSGRPTSG